MTVTTEPTYSSAQVLNMTGTTYRCLDHWCRVGYLGDDMRECGSGIPRRFTDRHVSTIRALNALSNGLSWHRPDVPSPLAVVSAYVLEHGPYGRVRLAEGVYLDLDEVFA